MTSKQMHDLLIRLDGRTEVIASDLTELKYVINGNGTPGLKDTVTRHDEHIKTLKDDIGDCDCKGGLGKKEMMGIYAGVVGALVALAHVVERLVH